MADTREAVHHVAVRSAGVCMDAWTPSGHDARMLAEALYDAPPTWRISIDGSEAVFSREGKVVDLVGGDL